MEDLYRRLMVNTLKQTHNKLCKTSIQIINRIDNKTPKQETFTFHHKIQNLTDININKVETILLERGFQYNFETTPENWTRELIIDTETAINQLDENKTYSKQEDIEHTKRNIDNKCST